MPRHALEPAEYPFFDYRRFTFSLGIAAAGCIWLSGSTAARFKDGKMVVDGDLIAQAGVIHDKMKATLVPKSRDMKDVFRMVRYVTPAAIPQLLALDAEQAEIFVGKPIVSTVVVKSLLRPEALIEIEAVVDDGGAHAIDYLPSITAPDRATAWDQAEQALRARKLELTDVGRALEVLTPATSPQNAPDGCAATLSVVSPRLTGKQEGVQIEMATIGSDARRLLFASAEGDSAQDGVVQQCRDVYARLHERLVQSGAGIDTVVTTTEFIVPAALAEYRKTAEIRRELFSSPYPAATGVICERLMQPGALIAVEATAVPEVG